MTRKWALPAILLSLSLPARASDAETSPGTTTETSPSAGSDGAANSPTVDAPAAAASGPTGAAADEDGPGEGDRTFSHASQFGLRLALVGGYRMIFRYDESPFCSEPDTSKAVKDQQKFCGHVAPLALDVALSFAPLGSVEPYLWGRFGLAGEPETNTKEVVIVGAGARIYTMSDSAFKIFIEPAIGAELESGAGNPLWELNQPEYKKDIVFHLAAGPQYDVAKAVGIFASAGITTGILRSIHSNLELGLGVQVRAP